MNENRKTIIPGVILIAIGVLFLLNEMHIFYFRWRYLYPIVLIAISALFFVSFYSKNEKGSIFPATILLVLGVFFLLRNYEIFSFDYYFYHVDDFWPIFLIAAGAGFVALFLVRSDDWGVLIPGGILLFLGSVFILRSVGFYFWRDVIDFWPLILIAIGLSLVVSSFKRKQN